MHVFTQVTMVKLNELKYELFEFTRFGYLRLLPLTKQFIRGKRFSSNEEAIAAVEQFRASGKSLQRWYKIIGGSLELCSS